MSLMKIISAVLAGAFSVSHMTFTVFSENESGGLSPADAAPKAGIAFQTDYYSFRSNVYQDKAVYWNDGEAAYYEDWEVNDAEITGDGKYTVSINKSNPEGSESWNYIMLSTNIPSSKYPDFKIKIDRLVIDGKEIPEGSDAVMSTNLIKMDDYSSYFFTDIENAYEVVFHHDWREDKGPVDPKKFGNKIDVEFTVTGFDSQTVTGVQTEPEIPDDTDTPEETTFPDETTASAPIAGNGIPQISGENGKAGWKNISDEIRNAGDGVQVKIDMNGAVELPSDIIGTAAGKDIRLILDMGNVIWELDGRKIDASVDLKTVNMSVTMDTDSIPDSILSEISDKGECMQLSLAHDGEFGFITTMKINVGEGNNGRRANLFYYNEKEKKLEFVSDYIVSGGTARFDFGHASDYVLVISDSFTDTDSADRTDDTGEDEDKNHPTGFFLGLFPAALSTVLVIAAKKRIR